MGYLVTHIFASLLFAQLLGLLLGWLLWGYIARQRGIEVQGLRERIADMQLMGPRMAFAGDRRAALVPALETPAPLVEDDLTGQLAARPPVFFKEEEPRSALEAPKTPPAPDDLEAEVKEARLQHYEKQVRELEAIRDRVPLLQAELSLAVAGKREAENRLEETSTALEVRVNYLLSQIRDFERAAGEWDRMRDDFELSTIAKDKELSTAKALVRDLQNNQLPQKAEPAGSPGISALEHADLRDRYQKALKERDALAAQLETLKQGTEHEDDPAARLLELEEGLRLRDASLVEQVAQTESLLWRVAELEPFALAVPHMEDDLRRQESEITGHVAMHAENSDHIRTLLNRVAELEADSDRLNSTRASERTEWQHSLEQREASIDQHRDAFVTAQREHAEIASAFEDHAAEHAKLLTERDAEIHRLSSSINDMQSESAGLRAHIDELEQAGHRSLSDHQQQVDALHKHVQELEPLRQALSDHTSEIDRLHQAHTEKDAQVQLLSQSLAESQQRFLELEADSARAAELQYAVAERDADIDRLNRTHASERTEWQHSLEQREASIDYHRDAYVTAQREHAEIASAFEDRAAEHAKLLTERDAEIHGLSSSISNMQSESAGLRTHIDELEQAGHHALNDHRQQVEALRQRVQELEPLQQALSDHASEIDRLHQSHTEKDAQVQFLTKNLAESQQRLSELEPVVAEASELQHQLGALEERHKAERARMTVNSAQRIRRLRQSITNFKG